MRPAAAALLIGGLLGPVPGAAQEGATAAPPPGGIATTEPGFALGVGAGVVVWDEEAPYEGVTVASIGLERRLWHGVRGRARLGLGETELLEDPETGAEETDVTVILIDLDILFAPAFGPLRDSPVLPYAIGGLGSLVTDPSGGGETELRTETQSQWSVGGGAWWRPLRRWELEVEATRNGVRLLDPLDPENRDTETIHNLRWEGRVSWLF